MKAYIIKPFHTRKGSTVRNGLPEITMAIGDDMDPVMYVKTEHPNLVQLPACVEIWDETRQHLIWESAP
jgi:hypothetical protein